MKSCTSNYYQIQEKSALQAMIPSRQNPKKWSDQGTYFIKLSKLTCRRKEMSFYESCYRDTEEIRDMMQGTTSTQVSLKTERSIKEKYFKEVMAKLEVHKVNSL